MGGGGGRLGGTNEIKLHYEECVNGGCSVVFTLCLCILSYPCNSNVHVSPLGRISNGSLVCVIRCVTNKAFTNSCNSM